VYGEGLLCELSNPKTLVVFTSVIPPFVPGGSSLDVALFGVVFAMVGLCSCLVYVLVFSASRRVVRRPRLASNLMRGSGGVLVGFGVGLAVEGVRQA
jgi:threonine/homoserine/homoserine lactone efflux protein